MSDETFSPPFVAPAASASFRTIVLVTCLLIITLDGLDTTAIAFVVPVLAREWGLAPAAFSPAFVATSLGAVVGYMASGPLAARFGQRGVALSSVVLFGVGSVVTALAPSVGMLAALRFVTAIGLGGCLPVAVAVGADALPAKYRATAAMIVTMGLSIGAIIGGLVGAPLMTRYGWQSIFLLGGVLPLVLLPLLFITFKPPVEAAPARGVDKGQVGALFRGGLAPRTTLLWLFSLFVFLDTYALSSWVPTLLTSFGFGPEAAAIGTAVFGVGGVAGNVVMIALVARFGVPALLMVTTSLAIACIVFIGTTAPAGAVLPLLGGLGAGLITGCVGQAALAVSFYPAALRATGVGWSSALGRIGSIIGPAVGGFLLGFGWPARDIILTAAVPAVIALLFLGALVRLDRRTRLS